LQREDFGRGIINVLSQLTIVGDVSQASFEKQFDWMFPSHIDTYFIVVIIDKQLDKVIGSGTLILERKFLRSTGNVGDFCLKFFIVRSH
jgi:glucosamine-phosphate N-acetyltransferase